MRGKSGRHGDAATGGGVATGRGTNWRDHTMTRGTYEDWWRVGDRIEIDFNGRSYMATLTKCRAILTFTYEVDGSTEKIPPESLKERVLRKLPAIALVKGDARVSPVAKSKAGAARKGMAKKATAKSVQSKGKTKGAAAKGALRRSSRPRKKVSYVDDTKYDVEDSNSSSQSSASESEESESESEAYSTESEEEDNDDEDYDNLVDEGPRKRKKQTKSKTASSSSSSSSPSSASGGASESLILDLFGLSEKRRQEQNKFRNRNKKKRRDARPLLNQRGWHAEKRLQKEGEEYFDPATLQNDMSTLPVEILRRQFVLVWELLTAAEKKGDFAFDYGRDNGGFNGVTVQTACSGTDGPIIALQIFSEIANELKRRHPDAKDCGNQWSFDFRHIMSCEITPFKQAYLVRNFKGVQVFADIKDLAKGNARTAFGGLVEVPRGNFFIAGTSCKDFSTLRTSSRLDMLEAKGVSGETFFAACEFIRTQCQRFCIFENVEKAPWTQMEQYLTGVLPLWSVCDNAASGKKSGGERKTLSTEKTEEIKFTLNGAGKWEVSKVPPKNGCRHGSVLHATERYTGGWRPSGHTFPHPKTKPMRTLVPIEKEIVAGTEMSIWELCEHLKLDTKEDQLVFEGPLDPDTNEMVFYSSWVSKVNTAHYGLPQVRNRKYMFVYRLDYFADVQSQLDEAGFDIGELFEELMEEMQHEVSYPLSAYIPDSMDPRVRRMRDRLRSPVGRSTARQGRANNSYALQQSKNWEHGLKTRKKYKLLPLDNHKNRHAYMSPVDTRKPITNWGLDGQSQSLLYNCWPSLFDTVCTQRRRDMTDIFAMNQASPVQFTRVSESHDALHTGYIWDVSQNCSITNAHPATPGFAGCLTPAGCSFLPSEGRILTGAEKLGFQGIPIDRLALGAETEMQLGDLAGNAMSLPVISAAMLAALSVKEFARKRIENPEFEIQEPKSELLVTSSFAPPCNDENEDEDMFGVDNENEAKSHAMVALLKLASLATQAESASCLCVCETSGGSSSSPIIQCRHCNLSLCRACSERGLRLECHEMQECEFSTGGRRVTAGSIGFEQKLRCLAPPCFRLPEDASKVIGDDLLSSSMFHLKKVKRKSSFWELTYAAAARNGRLLGDLVCSVGRVPLLEGQVEGGLGLAAYIRIFPEGQRGILPPVVRLHLAQQATSTSPQPCWEIQSESFVHVNVEGSCPTPSFRSEMGSQLYQEGPLSKWPGKMTIAAAAADGDKESLFDGCQFTRLPCRGSVNQGALWHCPNGLYMLIRPNPNRTSTVRVLISKSSDYRARGAIVAKFPRSFMPEVTLPEFAEKFTAKSSKSKKRKCTTGSQHSDAALVREAAASLQSGIQRLIMYEWSANATISLFAPRQQIEVSGPSAGAVQGLCDLQPITVSTVTKVPAGIVDHIVEPCAFGSNGDGDGELKQGDLLGLPINGVGGAASQMRHRFAALFTAPLLKFAASGDGIQSLGQWQELPITQEGLPKWGMHPEYVPTPPPPEFRRVERRSGSHYEPVYDGTGSNAYEAAVRGVPDAWVVNVNRPDRKFDIIARPCVPCHQAAGDLLVGRHIAAAGSVRVMWRVCGTANEVAIVSGTTAGEQNNASFSVPTSAHHAEKAADGAPIIPDTCEMQPMFVGKHPVTGKRLKLFPRQQLALARMVAMEAGDVQFTETELRQASFRGMPSWVLEAKATRETDLKGGVLADVMGGGKTATTIALIAQSCEKNRAFQVEQVESDPSVSAATLVVVPPHLTTSWEDEVKKFTKDRLNMIVINEIDDLLEITRQDLCEADIVVVSMAILISGSGEFSAGALTKKLQRSSSSKSKVHVSYLSNLSAKARFAGLPIQLPKVSGFKAVDSLVGRTYVAHPANPYGGHGAQGVQGQNKRNDAAYFTAQYWKTLEKLRKREFSADQKGVPLEWFQWARLVFDECHEATCPPSLEPEYEDGAARKILGKTKKGRKEEARLRAMKSELKHKQKTATQNALAARELMGLAAEGDAERPLHTRGGVWGLTGTPMLSSEDRVIELASMFRSYCLGQAKHWRKAERASRRDLFLQQLDSEGSLSYASARRSHSQAFVTSAVQRNRADEFTGTKVEIVHSVQMSPRTAQELKRLSPSSLYAVGLKADEHVERNFSAINDLRERSLNRAEKVAQVCAEIYARDAVGKIVVFAADDRKAFKNVCDALRRADVGGVDFFDDATDAEARRAMLRKFQARDQLESDRANARVLVLPFSHAAGHNFQYVSCEVVLCAPLWLGDPIRSCANEVQAIGRVFRSGQSRSECNVHRVLLVGPNGAQTIDHSIHRQNTDVRNVEAATSC
jgi:site-specific DNA-cytosine methylase